MGKNVLRSFGFFFVGIVLTSIFPHQAFAAGEELNMPDCTIPIGQSTCLSKPSSVSSPASGAKYTLRYFGPGPNNLTADESVYYSSSNSYTHNPSGGTGTPIELHRGKNTVRLYKSVGGHIVENEFADIIDTARPSAECASDAVWNATTKVCEANPGGSGGDDPGDLPRPVITGVTPAMFAPSETVSVTGFNFTPETVAIIYSTPRTVDTTFESANKVTFVAPDDLPLGDHQVAVKASLDTPTPATSTNGIAVIVQEAATSGGNSAPSSSLVPCGRNIDDSNTTEVETAPCTICHIVVGGNRLITWGRNIMSIIAITVIVAMGILYIVSAGNEGLMKTAKSGMLAALVGFAVMLTAWLIVNVVLTVLVDTGNPDKPFLGLMQDGRFYFYCDTSSETNR